MITWRERVINLTHFLNRELTLGELLIASEIHEMTPEEIQAQKESFARGMAPCEHGVRDFEECKQCRARALTK